MQSGIVAIVTGPPGYFILRRINAGEFFSLAQNIFTLKPKLKKVSRHGKRKSELIHRDFVFYPEVYPLPSKFWLKYNERAPLKGAFDFTIYCGRIAVTTQQVVSHGMACFPAK